MSPDPGFEDSLFGVLLQDSYKIVGLLGQGGMGAVYDAVQVRLNKRVAIKVMARELASNTEALNRFHREAMITSGLGHPHIVQVFDFATTPSGQPFLAMEFLDGEDLDRRIARVGRLSPVQTVHIVKQVASALAATHAQRIVHRDLKPANIYLLNVAGEDDFVKVLDFGISKIRAANTRITKASALIGTPDYMSPEQAMGMGDDVDERTDQWALACIAWECLAGRAPFFGDSIPSMLFQVVHKEPPSLTALVEGLPRAVETVLRRALAKSKDERYPSVIEFSQALEAAVAGRVSVSIGEEAPPARSATARAATEALPGARAADIPYESLPPEERSERPTSTFSLAAKETGGEDGERRSRPKWHWAVAAGGAVAVVLVAFLVLRPASGKARPSATSASAPAAPVPAPTAEPVPAAPPTAPAAVLPPAAPSAAAPGPAPTLAPEAVPAAAAPVPANHDLKAEVEAAADSKVPASGEPEGKRRTKKAGGGRQPGKAAVPKSPVPVTERRLIKEL